LKLVVFGPVRNQAPSSSGSLVMENKMRREKGNL
jgi:hypothetical protein